MELGGLLRPGFPRLYAAASLKQEPSEHGVRHGQCFPRLYAAASLKRVLAERRQPQDAGFSAALCRGLIEAPAALRHTGASSMRFPRLYAAASLKPRRARLRRRGQHRFSAALCRGLIEAELGLYNVAEQITVFRGFMPRPH